MGKDSAYYKEKRRNQLLKLKELKTILPSFATAFLNDRELITQPSTLVSYAYDLLTFFRYLRQSNPLFNEKEIHSFRIDDLSLLSTEDIVEFQRYLALNVEGELHENGKKAIARKMSPLRGMFQYLYEHKNITQNPMVLVKLPKLKKDKNIIRMNPYEIEAVLNAIEYGNEQMSEHQKKYCRRTLQRDLAIMTLMLGTGIRVSECAGLDLNDLNFIENSIVIVRKGGGQDVLYFGEEVRNVLLTYVNGERTLIHPDKDHENALFLSLQSRRISVDAIENLVKKYARMAVPNKKITPHKLRSTYGTKLYQKTGDIRLVADVLGHENINTTIDYYAAIEDEHKRMAANAVTLRNKGENENKNPKKLE